MFCGWVAVKDSPNESKEEEIMKMHIVGRQINVYEETKEFIAKKLAKLDKYFREDGEAEATVTLSRKRNVSTLETTINADGVLFRSEVDAEDFRSAMDETVDHIERQIRKNKTRLAKKMRSGASNMIPEWALGEPEEEEQDQNVIIRTKTFEYRPMSPEDAIMQMNLLEHDFFVFNDMDTGDTCVVYKRKDGAYGLIEPAK